MTTIKQENGLTSQKKEIVASSSSDQLLLLKQKMIAMKQQYETSLAVLQEQLRNEVFQKQSIQNLHQEELSALQQQQIKLKDLLKKAQEENKLLKEANPPPNSGELNVQLQKIEQFEKVISLLEEKNSEIAKEKKELQIELEKNKNALNIAENTLVDRNQKIEELSKQKQESTFKFDSQSFGVDVGTIELKERYESLKNECNRLTTQLDDAIKMRIQSEKNLEKIIHLSKEQESNLKDQGSHFIEMSREKEVLVSMISELKGFLDESENRLKTSQQHLAKKMKEAALLGEQVSDLQSQMIDLQQQIETGKIQNHHLQSTLDLYQKEEKKLQEQLHEALKSAENQVNKWEEKYFKMYDKWQECEVKMKDLKRIEEKYHQIQGLLANLSSFMNNSFTPSPFQPMEPFKNSFYGSEESSLNPADLQKVEPPGEERYDLFGMRYNQDKFRPTRFHE